MYLCCFLLQCITQHGNYSSDFVDEKVEGARTGLEPPQKKAKKASAKYTRQRGRCSSASKRAAQYPGVFEERDGEMICLACQQVVDHSQSTFAERHRKSKRHLKQVEKMKTRVKKPGPAAAPAQEVASSSSQPVNQTGMLSRRPGVFFSS